MDCYSSLFTRIGITEMVASSGKEFMTMIVSKSFPNWYYFSHFFNNVGMTNFVGHGINRKLRIELVTLFGRALGKVVCIYTWYYRNTL